MNSVARIAAKVRRAWEAVASEKGMQVHSFDGGMELRVPGRDKGTAVEEVLLVEPPDAFAIYLGDDISDEDAFHAIRDRGYGVLVRAELRPTKAQLWTQPPQGVLTLLDALNE